MKTLTTLLWLISAPWRAEVGALLRSLNKPRTRKK